MTLKEFLNNIIDFNAVKSNFMSRKFYKSFDTFVDCKFKHIIQWCDEVSKRRLNTGGWLWGDFFAKTIQVF